MDAMLSGVQAVSKKAQTQRSHSLRVRLGMVTDMAKVIEYYIPEGFRKKSGKWIPPDQRGKIIQFPATLKKSA